MREDDSGELVPQNFMVILTSSVTKLLGSPTEEDLPLVCVVLCVISFSPFC